MRWFRKHERSENEAPPEAAAPEAPEQEQKGPEGPEQKPRRRRGTRGGRGRKKKTETAATEEDDEEQDGLPSTNEAGSEQSEEDEEQVESIWLGRRLLAANKAAGAAWREDWTQFPPDVGLVAAVRATAERWTELAGWLEQQHRQRLPDDQAWAAQEAQPAEAQPEAAQPAEL